MFHNPLSVSNKDCNFFDKSFYGSMSTDNGDRTMNYNNENQAYVRLFYCFAKMVMKQKIKRLV